MIVTRSVGAQSIGEKQCFLLRTAVIDDGFVTSHLGVAGAVPAGLAAAFFLASAASFSAFARASASARWAASFFSFLLLQP